MEIGTKVRMKSYSEVAKLLSSEDSYDEDYWSTVQGKGGKITRLPMWDGGYYELEIEGMKDLYCKEEFELINTRWR